MLSPSMVMTEQFVVSPATAANSEAQAARILLIENDPTYREMLTDKLSTQGFAVLGFDDGASLLGALDGGGHADVILANWNVPSASVIDLLARLRKHGIRVPVLLFAGDPSQPLIDKSRDVDTLIGRLKAVTGIFRRQHIDKTIRVGKLLVHTDISRVYWDQADLCLSLGEYRTIELLASNAGHHVTYRAVYDRMHYEGFMAGDGDDGYRANVRSAIKRIRNKFRALDPTFDRIENYSGFGYCWKKSD